MAKRGSIFLNFTGLAPEKIKKIIKFLPDTDEIFQIKSSFLASFPFLNQNDVDKIISLRDSFLFEEELRQIKKKEIKVIDFFDLEYPQLLKQIFLPPLVLYAKGDLGLLNQDSLAVVGTRNPSRYGRVTAFDFSQKISFLKLVVVSGLAKGIDTQAHKGALSAGGATVAVLGSGLNRIYPHENKEIAQQISQRGLIISEYSLDTAPLSENFPRRNRIISGLAKGVIVIEAAKRSGALITANFALNQNREVFAVPGPINSLQSQGPNSLLKEGAKLVDSIEDVLEEINLSKKVITD